MFLFVFFIVLMAVALVFAYLGYEHDSILCMAASGLLFLFLGFSLFYPITYDVFTPSPLSSTPTKTTIDVTPDAPVGPALGMAFLLVSMLLFYKSIDFYRPSRGNA